MFISHRYHAASSLAGDKIGAKLAISKSEKKDQQMLSIFFSSG
jgi:hypothetical protein